MGCSAAAYDLPLDMITKIVDFMIEKLDKK